MFVSLARFAVLARPTLRVSGPLSVIAPWKALATAASGGSGLSPQDQTILEHLLKAEDCAESYYREMAAKAKNEGFRNIFLMIAKEEAKHTEWLQALAKDGVLGAAVKLNKSFLVRDLCSHRFHLKIRV